MSLAGSIGIRGWFIGVDLRHWRTLRVDKVDTYADTAGRRYATTALWVGPLCLMAPGRFYRGASS